MHEFQTLLDIIERLLAPDGCSWDREQTMQTLRHTLLEETCEVIEAIDLDNNRHIEEELGDLLFNVAFLGKLAEKEQRFTLKDALQHIIAKLIRRHPHVFGKSEVKTSQEVLEQWEEIKQTEKKEQPRHSVLDGIPKDLPALARAQKMAKKLAKQPFIAKKKATALSAEEEAGEALWICVQQMAKQEIQAEQALRKRLAQIETEFREWEQQKELESRGF